MKPAERIKEIIKREDISGLKLSNMLNLHEDSIKSITSGKVKSISQKVADAIVEKFPHYNKLWILTGEGEMLTPETKTDDKIKIIATPAEVQQELLRAELKMMREELSLMRQEFATMREFLSNTRAHERESSRPDTLIGIASDPDGENEQH